MLGRELMKFLIANPDTWREQLSAAPYNLTIREEGNYVLFKYSQIESDFNEPIVREARGIILAHRGGTWKIVRLAFDKFFNAGEVYADPINWNSIMITEKIDGSIMTLWYDENEWHLSTNGTIDAYKAEIGGKTFGELFDKAAKNVGLDLDSLSPLYNYTFELVGPYNKVVLTYPETTIYHLSTRDMVTLDEVFVDIGVQKPKQYFASNYEEIKNIVEQLDASHEGVVVRDSSGARIKIKTETYFRMHKMANNGAITTEYIMELILENETSEFLAYFPELRETVETVEAIYVDLKKYWRLLQTVTNAAKSSTRYKEETKGLTEKEKRALFAQKVKKEKYPFVWFAAYDNNVENIIATRTAAGWAKLIDEVLKSKS